MLLLDKYHHQSSIAASWENARQMRVLQLQDLRAGNFPNPLETADPDNDVDVATQVLKLHRQPAIYSGYTLDGKLVAFVKQQGWLVGDEVPFTRGLKRLLLRVRSKLRLHKTGQWGIFALIVSDELPPEDRMEILKDLLERAVRDPRTFKHRPTVNIPIHEGDPLHQIITDFGFTQVGHEGIAAGTVDKYQPRYQRTAAN